METIKTALRIQLTNRFFERYSPKGKSEIASHFGNEPNAAFRFVNPVLYQTRRRNILMTFANLVRQVQKSDELFIAFME